MQAVNFETATSIPSNPPPDIDVTITDSGPAEDLANAILDLPVMPPDDYNCPIDFGISYFLVFTGAGGETVLRATLFPNGCQWAEITGGGPPVGVERWAVNSPGFWDRLAADLGVPEVDVYPYRPPPQ